MWVRVLQNLLAFIKGCGLMDFILRHKFTYLFGVLLGILNFFYFKVTITNDILLIDLVIVISMVCISEVTNFVSKMLNKNKLFQSLFLDVKLAESFFLASAFQVLLAIIAMIGFFLRDNSILLASVWFSVFGFVIGLLVSYVVQVFKALRGLWQQQQNNKDLY